MKNFKKELIKYAVKEPFIAEEELKNIPSEIRNMVWKGYQKSLKKTLKTGKHPLFLIKKKKKEDQKPEEKLTLQWKTRPAQTFWWGFPLE